MSMANPDSTIQSNSGTWFFSKENGAFKFASRQNPGNALENAIFSSNLSIFGNGTKSKISHCLKLGSDGATTVRYSYIMIEECLTNRPRCLKYLSHGEPWPDRASAPPWSVSLHCD